MKIIDFRILTTTDFILLGSLIVLFLVQVYYLLRYFLRLALHKDKPGTDRPQPVTIILPVRNEESRIREMVARFSDQEFDDYQLLVINEYSEDNTHQILNILTETNPRLKVTSLSQETRFSGKQAINIGLKGASSPLIILITSASENINPKWLAGLNSLFDPETEAVMAYSNVERRAGFRNLICRMERFFQFIYSASYTLSGKPFVFDENNILFRKSLYFDTLGFRHKLNRNFANLELIFNENFRKGKVKVTTSQELAVREQIEDDRGDHIKLLKKGIQIRQSLPLGKTVSLFFDDLTRILLPLLTAVVTVMHPEYWIILSVPILVYLILLTIIVKMLINRLNERKILLSSLVYILIKPIVNWCLFWSMYVIHRRSRWN